MKRLFNLLSLFLCFASGAWANPTSQIINLSELTEDYIAQDGDVLTGTTGYSVQIAADATITLSDVTITNYRKSPIQCLGNATINIEDGSVNTLRDSDEDSNSYGRPALAFGPSGTTLTINGNTGKLIAIGGRLSSAIGCRDNRVAYGGLIINGGVISAHGNSSYTSGIGAVGADDSHGSSCGDITINGGTINVAASDGIGIGAGGPNSCGAITINGGTITSHAVRSIAIGGNCSKVVINGGNINASTTTSVGIGSSGVVYIEGGTIVASASDWEGVGISGDKGVLIRSSITSLTASKGPYGANAIQGATVYISANLNDVTEGNTRTLTPKASFEPESDLVQDGEGYYLIADVTNWKEFAVLSQIENSPKGKLVVDINLGDEQAMIGSFNGIFDGQGHTLTVNLTSTANVCGVFRYVADGAIIQNLRIAGTINGAHRWIGGFVGEGTGTYYINNCISSVTINTTYSGDGVQGGFVAAQRGTLYMNDCIFDGVFNGPNAYTWGGFVGWYYGGSTLTNCLVLCDEYNVRMSDVATFIAMSGTLNNCYYKTPIGTAQGTQATAAELADGTTATALQADRAEEVWVQDPVTNQPMLALFASGPGTFSVGNFKYTVTDEEHHYVSIAKADEAELSGALEIPSSVTYGAVTYAVTSVGASGFNGTGITSVTIPASVMTIGDAAFQNCNSLASITIEDSETPLTMPGTWYERPFWSPATTIYIGRDLTLTGEEVNPLTYDATSVEFGSQVTTINPALFYTNTKLASLTIGSGVTTIGESAFLACGQSDEVTETVVTMGNNVTSIGANAFQNCSKLKSITLTSKLTTIGNEAFRNTGLTSISIPASVTNIGDVAFIECASMTSITIADSEIPLILPGTYYQRPFWNPASTIYIGRDLTLTETEEDKNNPLLYEATSVEFGPKVTTINPALFYTNTKLTSLTIGSGVTTIGESAFYGCGTYWDDETNQGVEELVVTMGNNVTSIGANAFQNCSKLKSITLSSKLTTIGSEAFRNTGLTSISIPASVTNIGDAAFQDCGSMASITIEDSETPLTMPGTWYERPFWSPATTIYIGRDLTLTGEDLSYPLLDNATSVEFGPQMTAIPNYLFSGVTTLSSVKVPWLTPITLNATTFHEDTYTNATLWVPGGTMDAYEAADNWKEFAHKDFASFVVSITGSAHGTLAVGEISSTNNETATTLIDRGEDAVFTVTPATGYELTTFTVNSEAKTPIEGSYTVEDLSADQTVVAGFTPITYNLTYTLNGGTATNPATYTIETETFTLNNPTKAGYDFAGWKLNGEGDALMTVTIAQGSTGHLAYTATWTPTVYNIVYTMDGGTATPANPTTYTIETETFTLNNPTKTGHTFKGWKLNGEGDALMEVTIAHGSTGDKAYTATWQVNQYTITFDSNGGSTVDPITQDYGTTVTAPDDPTKPGCDFDGWSPAVPATMPAENITVTANWTELTYTVSITGVGVSADNMNPKYGDDVVITIAEDEDRTLNTLTVNGEDVTADVVDGQYTIHNVTGNVVVVATFNATKEFITLAQGVGTFSCAQDLNFTGSELKAYIAAGYNKSSKVVLLVRVYDVPAGTGLYLKGEADVTYKIPYSTSQAYYVNMLKANLTASSIAKTSGDMSNFLLNKVDGEYGFFAPSETATLGAQKAYLQVPTSFMSDLGEVRAIRIAFEDDGTTNISDFELFTNSNEHLYNLNGQRVEKAVHGLYIKNGKKVMIK